MPKDAAPEAGWLGPALIGVLAITALRVASLAFNRTDLFVDETQYWLWGQELAFGYYSKPPMIGWVIRLFTEIGGDTAFWIRLPAPLFHGTTALLLGALAARLFGSAGGIATALGFVTLPIVSLGSVVISTDTILFPFLAASLLYYFRLLETPSPRFAALAGMFLGLGFLSKYAAFYLLIGGSVAAILIPTARPRGKDVVVLLAVFLLVISPNILWNAANGFSTAEHTLDNADWVRDPSARASLNFAGLAEFFASQFAVFGPILFAVFLSALFWARGHPHGTLLAFALPALVLILGQALVSRAYANWAAVTYLAGSVLVLPALLRHRGWLVGSFAFHLVLVVTFPLITINAPEIRWNDRELLHRYLGRHAMSEALLAVAKREGSSVLIASERGVLADLFYTGRDSLVTLYAMPTEGRAPHHYALSFPYPGGEAPALFASLHHRPPCDAQEIETIRPETGAYRGYTMRVFQIPGDCWSN